MSLKLTATACNSAKPEKNFYKLTDGNGLYLLINPNGNKYWRYDYRFGGKRKTFSIGVYPEITLQEARERHREAHKLISGGIDPNETKKKAKQDQMIDSANTFKVVAKKWLEHRNLEWSKEYGQTILTRLENYVFPKLGNLPIRSIDTPMLLFALKAIEKEGVYETTKRIKQYCSQILRYAIAHGMADFDHTVNLSGAIKVGRVKHHAAFSSEELPNFLEKLDKNEERLFVQTRMAVKLMMLTFVRTNELIKATWDEIDFKNCIWTIPAERMKMRKAHIVPLSRQTIEILNQLREMNGDWNYVLPGQYSKKKSMSNGTIIGALYRMGYKGKATGHGFRALAMTTIMEKLGYRYEVPNCQLAHSKGDSVKAAYDRTQFLDERKIMMQEWADYIDNLHKAETTESKTDQILEFKTAVL